GDDDESRPFLVRELHIVQPKLVVVMGETALEFLNSLDFPLAHAVEYTPGELQRFTPTTEVLVAPDIDTSLDEAPAQTAFWNAFRAVGRRGGPAPPFGGPGAAPLVVRGVGLGFYPASHARLWDASTWWDVVFMSLVLIPACFALVWLVLPLRTWRWLWVAAL